MATGKKSMQRYNRERYLRMTEEEKEIRRIRAAAWHHKQKTISAIEL